MVWTSRYLIKNILVFQLKKKLKLYKKSFQLKKKLKLLYEVLIYSIRLYLMKT